MTEFTTPELPPTAQHQIIVERIKLAMNKFEWQKLGGLYIFRRSAAAEMLICNSPVNPEHEDCHNWAISLEGPSLRFRRALGLPLDSCSTSSTVNFIICNPEEALANKHPGIDMTIITGDPPEGLLIEDQMTYGDFVRLEEGGGILEKASGAQLLGRRAIDFLNRWFKYLPYPDNMPPSNFTGF